MVRERREAVLAYTHPSGAFALRHAETWRVTPLADGQGVQVVHDDEPHGAITVSMMAVAPGAPEEDGASPTLRFADGRTLDGTDGAGRSWMLVHAGLVLLVTYFTASAAEQEAQEARSIIESLRILGAPDGVPSEFVDEAPDLRLSTGGV